MECSHEEFVSNLVEINQRAGTAPELIDLLGAYTRLCLKRSKEIEFYSDSLTLSTNKAAIRKFISQNRHIDPRSLSFLVSYAEMMLDRNLPFIFNIAHLARFLDLDKENLLRLIQNKESYYHSFYIPKSHGGKRHICAPKAELKAIQKGILTEILEKVFVHPCANGFRRGRSIVSNAQNHVGQEIIIKMDIKDFFPSITFARVKGVYLDLGYPEGTAEALTELSTYKGRLPMGAPTSPYLSNIVSSRMDRRFAGLAQKMDFHYSRYADDLAFSSNDPTFNRWIPFFRHIIEDEGFEVNEKKVAIARKGGRQKLTGVVVNRKINTQRDEYKRLRAVIHNCLNGDIQEQMKRWGVSELDRFKNSLRGRISFVRMVNREKGNKLLSGFERISWPA
ncbi:retron St85 family RNA-directed DNA polymerase [Desulforhabdus amnigena]|uniref:RNA-directed DNA polymerase n=1 Tax=Desulforhabdus amnigena TaxID=40218 RepID=A0A9W6FSF8_9BACT|nr:retron St85 family RNA-directed DNA polymerase [Desulforhabdus amnigena]NLJ29544.1 RNA-directed DNA polymerase [Deltaproteobacteria bacterium]GLI34008.1 hypothetical protein DAMNIGENAA_14410 [Desulforhabdus amnigena]